MENRNYHQWPRYRKSLLLQKKPPPFTRVPQCTVFTPKISENLQHILYAEYQTRQLLKPTYDRTLPKNHRFFKDCYRENQALFIEWILANHKIPSWFVTQDFKQDESPEQADKDYRAWAIRLTQSIRDKGGSRLSWLRAEEWQIRGVIHYHSVVQGIGLDLQKRKSWEDRWESLTLNTGFCRIYDADLKAAPYLAKYSTKRKGGKLHWGGYWQGSHAPASVSCGHLVERLERR